jgi:hypothetical protein
MDIVKCNFYKNVFWPALFMMSKVYIPLPPSNPSNLSQRKNDSPQCLIFSLCYFLPKEVCVKIKRWYNYHPIPRGTGNESFFQWVSEAYFYMNETDEGDKGKILAKYESFSKDDWGPIIWRLIHTVASNYDGSIAGAIAFKSFLTCLTFLLPCKMCREHLHNNLAEFPIDGYINSRIRLFYWTYLLHDRVNKSLGRRSPPFQQIMNYYSF